jgi:hypothetical protein
VMYTKPSRPYWVCLKRNGEIVDPTPHVIFGEKRLYTAPTYRSAKMALCGQERGANGWRLVQRRDSKAMPDGYCEECWLLSLVEQMAT